MKNLLNALTIYFDSIDFEALELNIEHAGYELDEAEAVWKQTDLMPNVSESEQHEAEQRYAAATIKHRIALEMLESERELLNKILEMQKILDERMYLERMAEQYEERA